VDEQFFEYHVKIGNTCKFYRAYLKYLEKKQAPKSFKSKAHTHPEESISAKLPYFAKGAPGEGLRLKTGIFHLFPISIPAYEAYQKQVFNFHF
jgi:hypothetical protein